MGGQKAVSIDQFPILSWYHREFKQCLLRPDAQLMVIGYSFSDAHINDAISDGVKRGLKLFIIDPLGIDLFDRPQGKFRETRRDDIEPLRPRRDVDMEVLARNVIGASRRPLASIFNDDVVEHQRVMKFFS